MAIPKAGGHAARMRLPRRMMLRRALGALVIPALPRQGLAAPEEDGALDRLLQAALPAHGRHGRQAPDLPLDAIRSALAATTGGAQLEDHLLARLDLTASACRSLPLAHLRARLQAAVRADFRRGLVIEAAGWCLSETEGIVYALAHGRQGWAQH
jgi:hypothetical protein